MARQALRIVRAPAITIVRNASPPPLPRRGRPITYPFDELDVGDAFDVLCLLPKRPSGQHPEQDRITAAARNQSKRHGGKFTVRLIRDGEGNPVARCWRIA